MSHVCGRCTEREREKSIILMATVMYIYAKRDLRIIPWYCAEASPPVSTQLMCERHTEREREKRIISMARVSHVTYE